MHSPEDHRDSRFLVLAVALLSAMVTNASRADVIHVYEGESIQAAIDIAVGDDKIIVHPGLYNEAIDFLGKAIRLKSAEGPAVTVIDAAGLQTSVVTCTSAEGRETVLDGFTITGGDASGGGGMYNQGSSPTVLNSVFRSNFASEGGGMLNENSQPLVVNCVFEQNVAFFYGGGMMNIGSSVDLVNCAFVSNEVTWDTGSAICSFTSGLSATNCIVWSNTAPFGPQIYGGGVVRYSCVEGGYSGPGNIDVDPLFVDPASNNYRLNAGSPCIDAGDGAAVPPEIAADLDGNPRFVDDPATPDTGIGFPCVDMGAYEFQVAAPCPADVNGDSTVNVLDLLLVLAAWGATSGPEDINGDGVVDVLDLLEVLAAWGPCP